MCFEVISHFTTIISPADYNGFYAGVQKAKNHTFTKAHSQLTVNEF